MNMPGLIAVPGGLGPADFHGAAFRAPEAGGGFEAVDGDEAGELVLGGGGLDEAGEIAGFGFAAFPGVGAGIHDAQGGGDGNGFDGPAGFGPGEGDLVVGAGNPRRFRRTSRGGAGGSGFPRCRAVRRRCRRS